MPGFIKLVRIPSLKTVTDFRNHVATLGIDLPCDDSISTGPDSPLNRPVDFLINGKRISNRFAVQPMEGWDGTTTGGITEEVLRRWQRFGESGAKLIFGGEAMAVRPDGRANPNQCRPVARRASASRIAGRQMIRRSRRSERGHIRIDLRKASEAYPWQKRAE